MHQSVQNYRESTERITIDRSEGRWNETGKGYKAKPKVIEPDGVGMEGDAFFQACRDKMRKGTRRFVSPVPVGARIRKILRFINICTARPANISKSIWTMRPCVPFRRARRYRGQTTREPRDSSFFSLSLSLPLPFPRHFSPGIVASRVKSRNNEKEERGGRMRWEGGKGRRANEGEKKKKKRKKRKIIERASLPVSSLSLSLSFPAILFPPRVSKTTLERTAPAASLLFSCSRSPSPPHLPPRSVLVSSLSVSSAPQPLLPLFIFFSRAVFPSGSTARCTCANQGLCSAVIRACNYSFLFSFTAHVRKYLRVGTSLAMDTGFSRANCATNGGTGEGEGRDRW